jgi:RimJ/RimL family protein N-acetyltransferase
MQLEVITERLVIRPFREGDEASYLRLAHDIGFNVFSVPGSLWAADENEARQRLAPWIKIARERGLGKWLVLDRARAEPLGIVGLNPFVFEGREEIEIGYRFRLDAWGQGYAVEAGRACLDYGLRGLALPRIFAFAVPQNLGSIAIMSKIGMRRFGSFEYSRSPHELYVSP